jgi:hypothetical protein
MKKFITQFLLLKFPLFLILVGIGACKSGNTAEKNSDIITLSDNAGWCWFQDNRAIIDGNQLLFGSVTSKGAIIVSSYNIESQERQSIILNKNTFKPDDHNVGVLLVRPDGRYLTVYAGHGNDPKMRYRISTRPGDISEWEPEKSADTKGNTTYSNVYRLSSTGKTYNFHRGVGTDPNYMISEDDGDSWQYGGRLFSFKGRPYVRYSSNDIDQVHFITTEEHPRHYNNSIYHGYIKGGNLYNSDGKVIDRLSTDENIDLIPQDFTRVYDGNSKTRADVAWTSDIELDESGYPYIAFSVTKDPIALGETKNTQKGGFDNRYHYARWDGQQWHENEIAFAGTRLYPGENEYTGLIALHPENPDVVYISADVNPVTGKPLGAEGDPHYEIFKGVTKDGGATWEWTAITKNSDADNIRPIVVTNDDYEAVIWLNGSYTTYQKYDLKAVGLIERK